MQSSMVREDESSWLEVAVTSLQDGIEHGLVKKEVSHPFGDDYVKLLNWELGLFEFAFHEGDGWGTINAAVGEITCHHILSANPFASMIF